MKQRHGTLEAADPAEGFGPETHLLAEQSDEAARALRLPATLS
jgi:hypothetical protein